jgi:parvulin-like peptidyl-prolyl isomerase
MWEKHLKDLKEEKSFKILGQNIKEFSSANIALSLSDTLSVDKVKNKSGSVILAEWDNGNCNVNDLMDSYMKRYSNKLARFKSTLLDSLALDRDVNQLANYIFVAQVAEKEGYEDKEIQQKLDDYLEYSLVKLVEKKSLTDKIDVTDEEMEKYYNDNISEFTTPEKIKMWEIFVADEKKANQVYKFANSGRNFEELAKSFSEDKNSARSFGRLGFRSVTSKGIVSKKAFEAGPNQILKPFQYNDGWLILKTGEKKEKIVRSFDTSQRIISGKIRTKKTKEKREAWEVYLSENYPAKINTDLMATI